MWKQPKFIMDNKNKIIEKFQKIVLCVLMARQKDISLTFGMRCITTLTRQCKKASIFENLYVLMAYTYIIRLICLFTYTYFCFIYTYISLSFVLRYIGRTTQKLFYKYSKGLINYQAPNIFQQFHPPYLPATFLLTVFTKPINFHIIT